MAVLHSLQENRLRNRQRGVPIALRRLGIKGLAGSEKSAAPAAMARVEIERMPLSRTRRHMHHRITVLRHHSAKPHRGPDLRLIQTRPRQLEPRQLAFPHSRRTLNRAAGATCRSAAISAGWDMPTAGATSPSIRCCGLRKETAGGRCLSDRPEPPDPYFPARSVARCQCGLRLWRRVHHQ